MAGDLPLPEIGEQGGPDGWGKKLRDALNELGLGIEKRPKLEELDLFLAADCPSTQAAIEAAAASGGGEVCVGIGGTLTGPTIQMKSKVILSGPLIEWSVWGYNADPENYQGAWLEADASSGPVINFGPLVHDAGVRNLMVLGTSTRDGIKMEDSTTRGGNRLRNVYVNGAANGIYLGQHEARCEDICVMACAGDGVRLTTNSGPLRAQTIDTFDNGGVGLRMNGSGHMLDKMQSNTNQRQGVLWEDCTHSTIIDPNCNSNGREYNGTTKTTRYPNVQFAHPTTSGNVGCALVGGLIYSSGAVENYGIRSTEASAGFAIICGVSFNGAYSTGSSPFNIITPLINLNVRGC